jgi:hypothetical protein
MTIETAFAALLEDQAGVPNAQIHLGVAPASASYPFASFQLISESDRFVTLNGPSGMGHPRIQVDCYARTFREAKELSETIREAIDGYRGTQAGVVISSCIKVSETYLPEPERSDTDTLLHRISTDYSVIFEE